MRAGAMLLAGGLALVTGPAGAAGPDARQRLVYREPGLQTPPIEVFEVRAERVDWLRDGGRLVASYDRRSGVLSVVDPASGTPTALDGPAVAAMAAGLAQAARTTADRIAALPAAEQPRARQRLAELMRDRGQWAAVDAVTAADPQPDLGRPGAVAGLPCRWVGLQFENRRVGEACLTPPERVPGGAAVVQALQAAAAVLDVLRARQRDWPPGWPANPLVSAARTGDLPLRVVRAVPGEPRRALELVRP